MNQKIKNANPKFYDGIQFLSTLEVDAYKLLKEAGFDFKYEPILLLYGKDLGLKDQVQYMVLKVKRKESLLIKGIRKQI